MDLANLHTLAKQAARLAGDEIKEIKHPLITTKPDGSVLSSADLRANEIITSILSQSQIPVCSEEALIDFSVRQKGLFWLVDPLDGSSNFLKNRQNYAVCIALIKDNRPIIGVIYDVSANDIYSGFKGGGVFRNSEALSPAKQLSNCAVLSMRQHSHRLNKSFINEHDLKPLVVGSALKFCALLDGRADVYARFDSLNSWDIAAGDFLISEQGGLMIGLNHKLLDYNQSHFACEPFIAVSAVFNKELK